MGKKWCGRAMYLLLILLLMLLSGGCGCDTHTSDESMIAKFFSMRTQFEKLITMSRQDRALYTLSMYSIGPGEDHGLTNARIEEYREILRNIDCRRIRAQSRSEIRIIESVQGMSISGSVKYFVYFTEKPIDMTILPGFKLTSSSLEQLKNEELPEDMLAALYLLKDQEFIRRHEFLDAVKKQVGQDDVSQYEQLIVKYAQIPNVLDVYCANTTEEGKVYRHIEGNWYIALDIEF